MCIICNMLTMKDVETADAFLIAFAQAQGRMKAAAQHMLEVSKVAAPQHRSRYDAIHKEMVRQIREWNKMEEKREHTPPTPT